MQVIILCGGLGTRLKEETEFRPKPMVPIGGKPILWHIMKIYAHYGHTDFILPLGYKGEMIKEYFYHYHLMSRDVCIRLGSHHSVSFLPGDSDDTDNWTISMIDTGEKTLKGGRLKRVEKYLAGNEVMVTYGDGLADIDINKLLAFHRSHGKTATMTAVSPGSQFGELKIKDDHVIRFREKPKHIPDHFVSGGFYVFNRSLFDEIEPHGDYDLENDIIERLAEKGELMAYRHPGNWACMDTLRDMDYLNRLWDENNAFWKIWK